MNRIKFTNLFLCIAFALYSCKDKRKSHIQYMPDMYTSVAYEPYAEQPVFKNAMEAQKSVEGTIARGHIPYGYPDTNQGYDLAKKDLKSPLSVDEIDPQKGKVLYDIYCAICHGKKGDGQGDLVKREKFLGIPSYKDRDITQGSIYHVIMHGRNLMGSHASQLTTKERWQVVYYVQELKESLYVQELEESLK